MTHSPTLRPPVVLAVLGAAAILTGCTPAPAPTATASANPPVDVAVEWEVAPSVALETDPWVIAARESDVGYRLAVNALDFTADEFVGTRTAELARFQWTAWRANGDPVVYAGPSILAPLGVEVAASGTEATLSFCEAPNSDWVITADAEPAYSLSTGRVTELRMVTSDDGALVLEDRIPSTLDCDPAGAAVGRFDPVPEPRASVDQGDVRPYEG